MLRQLLNVRATRPFLIQVHVPLVSYVLCAAEQTYPKQEEVATTRPWSSRSVYSVMAGSISQPKIPVSPNPLHESIFVSGDDPVYDIPMSVIHRPLQSFTEESKVEEFMENMRRGDDFTPIEVLWVQKGDDDYYFAFGGCHRWEAHKRLGKQTIKSRLVKTTPKSLSVYLGRDPFK